FLKKIEAKAEQLRHAAFQSRPQPMSPFGYRYVGFQRRMMAAVLDSAAMILTIIPLSFILTDAALGPTTFDMAELAGQLHGVMDPDIRAQVTKNYLQSEGRIQYFVLNSIIQVVLMIAYCMLFWRHFGATPGKMLTRLKV